MARETSSQETISFNIPPQRADLALTQFAEQVGLTLIFPYDKVRERPANRLVGAYTPEEAINVLLHGSGLKPSFSDQRVLNIMIDEEKAGDTMNTKKSFLAGVIGLMVGAGSAQGLSAAAETSLVNGQSARILDEVVVTARRRSENMQDVPVAITALTGDYLEQNNINNFSDIQYHAPSLTVSSAGPTTHNTIISLRGQRPVESNIDFEAAVPIYFADVVMTPSFGTNLALYDLESVQVLKGPQGTLFGRNSTGGAVLFSPARPGDTFGGYGKVTAGNYGLVETEAAINLPASDRLRFRLAMKTVDRDHYQTNVSANPDTRGTKHWDEESRAFRISMDANITDSLTNSLIVSWDEVKSDGRQPVIVAYNPSIAPQLHDDVIRTIERNDPTKIESDQADQFEDVENWFVANTTVWDIGQLTVKNILGYRKVEWGNVTDGDGSAEAISNGLPSTVEAEQFSNELQLLGQAFDDRLEWIVGGYYYQMQGTRFSRTNIFGMVNTNGGGDVDNSAYAVFAQGSYDLSEKLSITLGARMSWDDREITTRSSRVINHPVLGAMASCDVRDENGVVLPLDHCHRTVDDKWSAPTWLASLSYRINDMSMIYGSIGTGYRTGGFSLRGTNNLDLQPFDEENVTNYEIGLKTDWQMAGGYYRANFALYYQDYSDIQRTTILPDPNTSGGYVTLIANAAEATIEGADFELMASPIERLDISLNYAYVHTKYDKYIHPNFGDFSGDKFGWVPKDQLTATIRYTLPVDPSLGDISLQANYYYQSDMLGSIVPASGYPLMDRAKTINSYSIYNYRIDWGHIMGSNVDLSLFVKNASNEKYPVGGLSVLAALGLEAWNYGAPRTWGASLRYRF